MKIEFDKLTKQEQKEKQFCGKCKTELLFDNKATYNHWKYYCDKCDEFKIV